MAGSSKYFAILRFAPQDIRDEILNIGIVIFEPDALTFHFSKGLEKIKSISKAIDTSFIVELTENMRALDISFLKAQPASSFEERCSSIDDMGLLRLGQRGQFDAASFNAHQARVSSLLKTFVDPEPAIKRGLEKRSRILTDMKRAFRSARVLAKKDEDLSSHRIVPSLAIDEGLTADLVLKNGALHVTETVDASNEDVSLRKTLSEIGLASLVLERAKMSFQKSQVKTMIVYAASRVIEKSIQPGLEAAEHQGARLINWESQSDRSQYLDGLISLATPYNSKESKARMLPIAAKQSLLH